MGGAALSPRELEVLKLIAAGNSNKEIATKLAISELGMKKMFDTRNATNAIPAIPMSMWGSIIMFPLGLPEPVSANPMIIWITSPTAPIAPASVVLFKLRALESS